MKYLNFFDEIETIHVKDELAKFLGVNNDGILEFSYLDMVKITGHSCATVAGAYLMALRGLQTLYVDELPTRGNIKVEIKKSPREDNSGVIGTVLSTITGATIDSGFGGLGDKFNRRDLLFFNVDIDTYIRLTRIDTKKTIGINYNPSKVINLQPILMKIMDPNATDKSKKEFPQEFQNEVKKLFQNIDKVVEIFEN